MNRILNKLISHLAENQKTLFLIDSLGAALTAFILFVMMRHFKQHFGMPKTVLIFLLASAVCFSIYSAVCSLFLKARRTLFISLIGFANLLYCVLTIGLVIKYRHLLTLIGIGYFLIETVIICTLSYLELNAVKEIKKRAADS